MNFQIIEQQGQKFVQVPLGIFQKLEEDAEMLHDLAAAQAAKQRWIEDGMRTIPHSIVKRVIYGENIVLVWREHRGFTQVQLSEKSGVSRPLISQIESGKKNGSIATMKAIAQALDCMVDDLI